ncbi:spinster family MFS transporter [Massilia cavernae]|uniref:MFS transporter n=1 Tax=Massilia cavernae TaxID=2320864 RepID=A0A418Y0X0_9BURK|nr:MFS transporter [Massilia cavernae]RJG19001.1 MFS transporter [Massilia cavernae]
MSISSYAGNAGEAAAPPVPAWRRHYTLLLLTFVYAMSLIDRQIMGVLIEPVKREFQVSDTAMGLLTGLAFALFYSTLAVPMGRLADRSNRRNMVALCCGAWSLMTGLCGLAGSYWQLAAARVGVAIGEAGGTAPSLSMIADHYPPRQRSRAMSVFMLGPPLGTLFGLGLGAWLAQRYGWRSAFLWMMVPGVVAAILLRTGGIEPLRGRWDSSSEAASASAGAGESLATVVKAMWASSAFMRITVAGLLLGFAGYAIGIWSTAFLVRSHGLALKDAGILIGLTSGVAAICGSLFSGWLCDRLIQRDVRWQLGVPIIGLLLALPLGVIYLLYPAGNDWQVGPLKVPHAMVFNLLFSFFSVWWTAPSFAALTALVASHRRTTVLALYSLGLTMFGGGLGPLFVGMLSDALTPMFGAEALRWALVSAMGAYVLAMVAFATALNAYARSQAGVPAAR